MSGNLIVLAKQFDEIGCVAYRFKTPKEALSLPKVLESLRGKGMQIVIVNCPELYQEYSPYSYVDDMREIVDYVSDRKIGKIPEQYKFERIQL